MFPRLDMESSMEASLTERWVAVAAVEALEPSQH
jgi:hypothetical protein